MLRRALGASLDGLDRWWANRRAAAAIEAPHLVVALFHVLHRTRRHTATRALAPNQQFAVDDLNRFLDAMLDAGYSVVSCEDLAKGVRPGKLLHLTFDDGYFNNTLALPVLEAFQAPATFFIATDAVRSGKAFWWDAAARPLAVAGKSRHEIHRWLESMKAKPVRQIERELAAELGQAALRPVGDADRPFRPDELRDFARSRWVSLGNHTAGHEILTRCSPADAAAQIAAGRDDLREIAGVACRAIAYPNGNVSSGVVDAARTAGHDVGFTCEARANPVPRAGAAMLTLGRHLVWGNRDYAALVPQLAARQLPGTAIRAGWRRLAR